MSDEQLAAAHRVTWLGPDRPVEGGTVYVKPEAVTVDVRARAVSAFRAATVAVHATGDRRVEELLHQLAVELGHHDTTGETLAGVMQAFAGATTEETSTDG